MARRTDDSGIDDELLQEFEKLTDEEVRTKLRKRITAKHSRAPKADIQRSLKLLQQGYRDVKTGRGQEQHIKIPIHDVVTELLKCLKAGATAEQIPIEIATGWADGKPFDWSDKETRTWVFFRARRAGVDPHEAIRALDPALPRRPFHPGTGRSGTYSFTGGAGAQKVARRRR